MVQKGSVEACNGRTQLYKKEHVLSAGASVGAPLQAYRGLHTLYRRLPLEGDFPKTLLCIIFVGRNVASPRSQAVVVVKSACHSRAHAN